MTVPRRDRGGGNPSMPGSRLTVPDAGDPGNREGDP